MVAHRVSRRTAIVAAAGMVASPSRAGLGLSRVGRPSRGAPEPAGGGSRILDLSPDLARFLRDPDPDRARALRRALISPAGRRALAVHGPGLEPYLLDQTAGLGAADARWAARAAAAGFRAQVERGFARARALLEAEERPPVFLLFSRRFDGRMDGRRVFFAVNCFGAARLREGVALLAAHEYNHVVRARHASFATLLDGIVAEGLATVCSELAEPGQPPHRYLLFPPRALARLTPERVALLWQDVAATPFSTDPRRRRAYLEGGQAGPHGVPPRSGYYLGSLLVRRRLDQGCTLAELTRMPTPAIWDGGRDVL
jgi:hypothetical protein